MKRQPTRRKTIVNVLADADPRYVSLVDHGANQRPFHSVKRDHQPKETEGMPKQPAFKIHRVVFDPAHFATEDAVKSFLTGKGYTDFTVAKTDKGEFFVEDSPADDFVEGGLRNVPHSSVKGVTYIAGDAKDVEGDTAAKSADAGTAEETAAEPAAKEEAPAEADVGAEADAPGAEEAAKAESAEDGSGQDAEAAAKAAPQPRTRTRRGLTIAGKSVSSLVAGHEAIAAKMAEQEELSAKSFGEMLQNYNGAMPPGMYEMADAMMGTLRKMFHDGEVDEAKVSKLANDFTGAVLSLHDVYSAVLANKSVETGDEMLDALLAVLFDAPAAKDAGSATNEAGSASAAANAELMATLKSMQARMDLLSVELAESKKTAEEAPAEAAAEETAEPAAKAAQTERTVKARNSTEADETADAATKAEAAADDEAYKRAMRRTFGAFAAKSL